MSADIMPTGGVGSLGKRWIQIWSDLAYPPTVPGPSPVIGISICVLGRNMWSLILFPGKYLEGEGSPFSFLLFLWCYFQQPDSASKPLTMSLLDTGVLFCSPDITCTAHPGVCSGLHNSCDHSRFGDSKLIWSADFESSHTLFYQHALSPWTIE